MPSNNQEYVREISKIAFQAEEGIDEQVIERFGQRFQDRQVMIREGEIQSQIFWIIEGEVYVTKKTGSKYRVLTTLGKGEIIGEMSFFDESVRSATVIAKGTVQALVFSREDFHDIFKASPDWTHRLLVSLSKRIQFMITRLADLEKDHFFASSSSS